jgi:hypothetical protein
MGGAIGYNQLKFSELLAENAADATNIITVGHNWVAAVDYADGTAINALAADSFTDVQDINLGTPFWYQFVYNTNTWLYINVAAETAGDYVRAQIELDDVAILDISVGPSKAQFVHFPSYLAVAASVKTIKEFAAKRLRTRLYKHGTIDQAGSFIHIGQLNYWKCAVSP